MTATLPPQLRFQPLLNGAPIPGGKVSFYRAGTTTPQSVFAEDGVTPIGNELTLDVSGFADFRLGDTLTYKIDLHDADGAPVPGWPIDKVTSTASIATPFTYERLDVTAVGGETVFTVPAYPVGANGMWVILNGVILTPGSDYTETDTTTITLAVAADAGDQLAFIAATPLNGSSVLDTQVSFTTDWGVNRNQHQKNLETVSALDCGIVADGVTDDTANWISAVDKAPTSGCMLVLPAGRTSLVSGNIPWKSNVHLTIEAGSWIKLKDGSPTGIRVIDARGQLTNIGFYGPGGIDCNQSGQAVGNKSHGLAITAHHVRVINLEVKEAQCTAGSMGDGIILEPQQSSPYFQCEDVLIQGCYLHDNGRQQLTLETGIDVRIIGNRFENSTFPTYCAIDIEINDPTNDTIDGVIVHGNYAYNCDSAFNCVSALLPLRVQNVFFSDNIIDTCSIGYFIRSCKQVGISGGAISNCSDKGIWVYADLANGVVDCSIDNVMMNGGGTMQFGVKTEPFGPGTFTRISIKNMKINGVTNTCISSGNVTDLEVSCNTVSSNSASSYGIWVDSTTRAKILDNTVNLTGGSDTAFFIHSTTNFTFDGNTVIAASVGTNTGTCSHIWWGPTNDMRRASTPLSLGNGGVDTLWHGNFTGTFTMAAAIQANVNDAHADSSSIITLIPTNASAATLQAGATMLWNDPASVSSNVSFRVKTANGASAAGTETYQYSIVNP